MIFILRIFGIVSILLSTSGFIILFDFRGNEESLSPLKNEITAEYFPTDTSLILVYNSSMGEANAVIKKKGNKYVLDLRIDDFFFVQTIYVQNDTVYLTKLDQEIEVFLFISSGASVTYNRPYLRFPFPLKKIDTWT